MNNANDDDPPPSFINPINNIDDDIVLDNMTKNWIYFINRCSKKKLEHEKEAKFWAFINFIILFITGSLFTFTGSNSISDLNANENIIFSVSILGALMQLLYGILKPGEKDKSHSISTKEYSKLENKFIICKSVADFDKYIEQISLLEEKEDKIIINNIKNFSYKENKLVKISPELLLEMSNTNTNNVSRSRFMNILVQL
jgi:hypothetical protein